MFVTRTESPSGGGHQWGKHRRLGLTRSCFPRRLCRQGHTLPQPTRKTPARRLGNVTCGRGWNPARPTLRSANTLSITRPELLPEQGAPQQLLTQELAPEDLKAPRDARCPSPFTASRRTISSLEIPFEFFLTSGLNRSMNLQLVLRTSENEKLPHRVPQGYLQNTSAFSTSPGISHRASLTGLRLGPARCATCCAASLICLVSCRHFLVFP